MITTNSQRKTAVLALCFVAAFLNGCSLVRRKPLSPSTRLQTKTGAIIEQKGDAETPANVSENSTRSEIALPMGSKIDVVPPSATEPGKVSVSLAADSRLVSVADSTNFQGPKAFAPPAPETSVQIARGQAVLWSYGLCAVLIVAGGTLCYLGHLKAGIVSLLGAPIIPIAANLLTNTVAIAIGGAFLLVSVTLFAAWHLMRRKAAIQTAVSES